MADLKLVGAVAIKVRPDAKGFRRETDTQIDKELAGYDKKVKVTAQVKADTKQLERDVEKAGEEIEKKALSLKVGLDHDSVVRAQKQLEDAVKHLADEVITIDLDDEGSIEDARRRLESLKDVAKVEMEFAPDEKGFRDILAKIEQIRREKITTLVEFDTDDESLDRMETAARQALRETAVVTVRYTNDRNSLQAALDQIKAEQAKLKTFEFDVLVNKKGLAGARRDIEAVLANTPVELKINYDDQESLKATRARLREMLNEITAKTLEVRVDEVSLRAELAKIDALIKSEEPTAVVKAALSPADVFKVTAELKALARDQRITIFARLDNTGLLLAAAKLTGLRAATRWTEELGRAIGTLDRNLPIVAAVMLTLSTLASGVLSLTANMFSLGNGVGEVVRMAGLLAPAMVLGLGAVMTVFTAVFKDFGAAVHGIEAAFKRLPPSGQEAALTFRKVFAAARESISKEFWDSASDAMLRFSKTALPALGDGLTRLSGSLAGIFSGVLDSFTRLTQEGGVKVFFENLANGFDLAQTGMASFMNGFNTLAVVGSTVFPRIGKAFEAWATRFDAWVQRLALDGTLNQWINKGIQGLKDLGSSAGSLVKIWGNIGQSAQAAGALTLHSFAQMLDGLDKATAGNRFQQNMTNIFKGAREASDQFHKALGDLGPAMDVFSLTIKNTLSGAGAALGAFIAAIGDVFSSPKLDVGMTAFLTGLKSMFESLRPAAAAVAEILQTFGQILGTVASDSGPLFRNLFQQLATVLTTAWHALEPFLPGLIQIGTTVINMVGPALSDIASSVIPAFATALQNLGNGLLPLVELLADFAAGAITFIASMPAPVLIGIGTAMLTLSGAMRALSVVAPLAAAGMTAFGIEAGIAGARAQLLVPVLGVALAIAAGVAAGAVASFASAKKNAIPYANEYESALLADARAAKGLGDAVGDATKQVAIKKLVDAGAYEAAKKLGIGTEQLTDAVLKGGPAYDFVKGKIDGHVKTLEESHKNATLAAVGQDRWNTTVKNGPTKEMGEMAALAKQLGGTVDDNRNSFEAGAKSSEVYKDALKAAGIGIDGTTTSQLGLADQSEKTSRAMGEAAAATGVLTDAASSGPAKIDAMRKSLELMVGPNAKLQAAESLGAYAKGFQDLRDLVTPLAGDLKALGDSAYGEGGFLNVAGGNKAVLQINQALVDQVNNTWLGAKTVYDAAIQAGKDAMTAGAEAQKFIADRKVDYDQLATDSGVASEKVQGQWDAVFGKEWVLRVSLEGTTEAFTKAQQIITVLKGQFDGQKFQAFMDANPDKAVKAFTDVNGLALDFVNHEWKAQIEAIPDKAQATIRALTGQTEAEWNNGDFMATLEVAKDIPGLAQALQDIRNGVGVPFYANIFAQLNGASQRAVEIALLSLTRPRTVAINVAYSATGDVPVARGGQRVFAANGGLFSGRGVKMFANGGIENHVAQISRANGPLRIWGERETQGEAYVPLAASKRPRSVQILGEVARRFGYTLNKAQEFANGGTTTAGTNSSRPTPYASVTVGTINTVDPETAVRKLRTMQLDAFAVAGII